MDISPTDRQATGMTNLIKPMQMRLLVVLCACFYSIAVSDGSKNQCLHSVILRIVNTSGIVYYLYVIIPYIYTFLYQNMLLLSTLYLIYLSLHYHGDYIFNEYIRSISNIFFQCSKWIDHFFKLSQIKKRMVINTCSTCTK